MSVLDLCTDDIDLTSVLLVKGFERMEDDPTLRMTFNHAAQRCLPRFGLIKFAGKELDRRRPRGWLEELAERILRVSAFQLISNGAYVDSE